MKSMNLRGHARTPQRIILLLGALFLLQVSSWAQTAQAEPPAQTYAWKSGAEAIAIMKNQVDALNQQIPGIAAGTPLYDNSLRRVAYFKAIIQEISNGASVAESLDLSLPAAATLGFSKEATYTSKIVLRALKEEARVTLTN